MGRQLKSKRQAYTSPKKIFQSVKARYIRGLSRTFPKCNSTYPDCPKDPIDMEGKVHKMCVICPIFMESKSAKNRI